jgi:peptidoglycan/xylan/chitin deacetylase (PgdA/CDA1 family)
VTSIKHNVAAGIGSFIGKWSTDKKQSRVIVLCYHSIHPDKSFATVTPEQFERHLAWLETHARVIPFREVFASPDSDDLRPRVAITFDDGYRDNYDYAVPLLAKYGLSATFFVVAGLIRRDPVVIERCRMLQKTDTDSVRPMESRHLREMSQAGLEIGSHTYSHPNLSLLNRQAAKWEMVRSRQMIEQDLGRHVLSLAYPFGTPGRHIIPTTAEIAAEAGYELAGSILYRNVQLNDSRFVVPRFTVARDSLATLRAKVLGHWDFVGACQTLHPRWAFSKSNRNVSSTSCPANDAVFKQPRI